MSCLNPRCLPSYLKHSNHCTRRTILVSIRSFPWGNCGMDRSGVWRGQEGAQIARLSRFWQTFPAPRREVTRPEELPSGIPGAAGGPDPAAVADCRGPGGGGGGAGGAGRPQECASPSFVPRLEADPLLCTQVLICTGCTSPRYSSPTNN